MIDRLPPHSTEAEQGILGCILLDPHRCISDCLDSIKTPLAFYDIRHQQIYSVITEMVAQGEAVDLITLQQRLKDRCELESVGGLDYLCSLQDATPSAANLSFYLGILCEKYTLRQIIYKCTDFISEAYEQTGTVDEFTDKVASEILAVADGATETSDVTIKEFVNEAMEHIEQRHTAKGEPIGLTTGFRQLDNMLRGLHPGELTIIAARPGVGKTSLAMSLVEHIALRLKEPVGIFSLEMKGASLVERMLCSHARLNSKHIADENFTKQDLPRLKGSAGKVLTSSIHILDKSSLSILQLRAKARRLFQRHGIKLLVVDYIQLLHSTSRKAENRRLEIGEISRGLKTLAMDLNIPIVALSQLNREIEKTPGRKPRLSDLRESGDLEQDADVVWLLYRPNEDGLEDPYSSNPYLINVIVAKQRNGPTGEAPLTFMPEFTRFENAIIPLEVMEEKLVS